MNSIKIALCVCACARLKKRQIEKWLYYHASLLVADELNQNFTLPEILVGPNNVTAFLGDRVELQCKVSGRPLPAVEWISKRDGKLASQGPNFRVHKNNSLIFRRVEKRDESYYHCEAENRVGSDRSKAARLTVEGPYLHIFLGAFFMRRLLI